MCMYIQIFNVIYIYTHECICIKIVSYLYYPFNKIARQAWKNLLVPGKIRQGDLHVLEISLLNGWLMVKLGGHRNYSFAKGLIIQTFLIIYLYIHMYIYIYLSYTISVDTTQSPPVHFLSHGLPYFTSSRIQFQWLTAKGSIYLFHNFIHTRHHPKQPRPNELCQKTTI